jgi:hypothetical protein
MKRALKVAGLTVAALLATVAIAGAFRWLAVVLLVACLVAAVLRPVFRSEKALAFMLAGFIFCSLMPFDISFESQPGLPHFVRVVYGKPMALSSF